MPRSSNASNATTYPARTSDKREASVARTGMRLHFEAFDHFDCPWDQVSVFR
jgi:hypothetical protein